MVMNKVHYTMFPLRYGRGGGYLFYVINARQTILQNFTQLQEINPHVLCAARPPKYIPLYACSTDAV